MTANTNAALASAEPASLAHLSDAELLTQTRSLVGRSNRLLAELLSHLGEVEARGIHRTRACSSLYTYLIYELRFSEDEAFRRVAAARLVRRFPALLDAIAAGELHLTGLLMLGPHLTEENVIEVMARAKHRTKREIARLVRILDPLPSVPALIEPLGPELRRLVPPAPTWERFACSLNPVRNLEAGERPREWGLEDDAAESCPRDSGVEATEAESTEFGEPEAHAPARVGDGGYEDFAGPQRFKVAFTATEEYVRLVQEAKALLSHRAPRVTLEEIQLRALRAFVEALRKRKYGSCDPSGETTDDGIPSEAASTRSIAADVGRAATSSGGESAPGTEHDAPEDVPDAATTTSNPRRRGRYVPAAVRRAVAARDEHRCTYVDASGRRCGETQRLEFHHVVPFALCRSHEVKNLTLRCQSHNALAAEEDFGREVIDERRSAARHDSFSKQGP